MVGINKGPCAIVCMIHDTNAKVVLIRSFVINEYLAYTCYQDRMCVDMAVLISMYRVP